MSKRVVILGAGFGGLELSSRLSEELGADVDVALIDKNDSFFFGYSKLDVMFGKRKSDEVRMFYKDIAKPGVRFRQETVTSIDPAARRVETDGGEYEADYLVVALGADYAPEATPGLDEGGYEFYSMEGAERAAVALDAFEGGRVLIAILGPFFKCPPAPFETAFLVHDFLKDRGLRECSTITITSPLPSPIPISPSASEGLGRGAVERDIEFVPQTRVVRIDPAARVATAQDGRTFEYDLLLGIPVHKAPDAVASSGLTVDGWIDVDRAHLSTRFPGVYAVGDVTNAPVPRAGVFAEGEAKVVADVIISEIRNGEAPAPYGGVAACYVEFGGEGVAKVDVDFLNGPAPVGYFQAPSAEITAEKEEFGASRRRRWFS
jgi:sulfide:quinone oxidoreductase